MEEVKKLSNTKNKQEVKVTCKNKPNFKLIANLLYQMNKNDISIS